MTAELSEKSFKPCSIEETSILFGKHDENLKLIEKEFGIQIVLRGEEVNLKGSKESVIRAMHLFDELLDVIRKRGRVGKSEVIYAVRAIKGNQSLDLHSIYLDRIEVSSKRHFVTPRTAGQKAYVDAIRNYDVVFSIGPAGTGKTYLAMAMAVSALDKGEISRIILTRPAVEAGESLGFLPGTLYEKVTPYLRPLYDALYDMVEADKIERFIDRGIIEVAPLAYMRGRTLNDAFIILDEAQNSTIEQMKMFLTRLGFDSKTVITGDITQSDLSDGKPSGLLHAQSALKDIGGIKFIHFSGRDVVRHELVQEIIKAYEKAH